MVQLREKYNKEIVPALSQEFQLSNIMSAPRLEKIIVHMSLGRAQGNKEEIERSLADMTAITGQKPVITEAKKAIAGFKVRKGDKIGAKVTLRGARMWDFLDKLFAIVLPRTRDFQGLPQSGFDKAGNYSFGMSEQVVFLEIDPNKLDRTRGMQITLVTTGGQPDRSRRLLEQLGLPLEKTSL
jgi:large subunit ribosomal protein L5